MIGEYEKGFAAGWFAASQALMRAMGEARTTVPFEMAGNLPMQPRRRGRPPKSMTMAPPAKRPRGRPRKTPA